MKIAFAYRGRQQKRPEDIPNLGTSHMSEINAIRLVDEWTSMGHHVDVLNSGEPIHRDIYDLLYLFKVHPFRAFSDEYWMGWKRVAGWFDTLGAKNHLQDAGVPIQSIAWATPTLMEKGSLTIPNIAHTVVEHATVFNVPPKLNTDYIPRGLYLGRLPAVYLHEVERASAVVPMRAYALKVWDGVGWINLRPHPGLQQSMEQARPLVSKLVDLKPGINIVRHATNLSHAAYGLVPSTRSSVKQQDQSACKAWDYWALGLPVVISGITPEAQHVRHNPTLGWIYDQNRGGSLERAVSRAIDASKKPRHIDRRHWIQKWVFTSHTWRHRAKEIASAQF